MRPSVEKKQEEIAQAAKQTEHAVATFTSRRDAGLSVPSADRKAALVAPRPSSPAEEQPALALGTPAEVVARAAVRAGFRACVAVSESADDKKAFARCGWRWRTATLPS